MTFIIDGTAGATFPNGTNPQAAPSKVLQVVQITNNTQFATTSSSMITTNISASITPLFSTSKILIRISTNTNAGSSGCGISLARNGSVIFNPSVTDGSGAYMVYANIRSSQSIEYLDSPATTSSTAYALFFSSRSSQTSVINETANTNNGATTITLMEIAQ